jgi:CRISPR-associated protein Cas2
VFEGTITEAKLERLKNELSKTVKPDEDAICIYSMESTRFATKEQIGTMEYFSNII